MDEHHVIKWRSMIGLGLLSALVGIFVLFLPSLAATLFAVIAGLSILLLSGILLAEGLFIDSEGISTWAVFGVGILGIILGIVTLAQPSWLVLAAGVLIGVYLIIFGIAEGVVGLSFIDDDMIRSVVIVMGVVAIVLGLLILINPALTVTILAWLIGLFLLILGLIRVAHGLTLRSAEKKMTIKHL
jgi:uncharacterized membrane protein HdeD (DUF308 family)